MKTAILTKIALALALYLLCPGMSWAEAPEYDITVGRTIHTDKPVCLVYRHDGFWVTGGVTEGTLRHYSTDGTLLAEYQLPGSVSRYGVAWDGTHWWIADNNYGPETIYKCELNEAEKRLEPLRAYAWPHQGPSGLEWAQGYLWVSDHSTDIIYRVSVGDTSFTAIEAWCSTNPEPWDLAWDGTNIWSITGPAGGFDPVHGEREIYKHDAAGKIIEIWHYPPADDPAAGLYGGSGTGLAFAGSQLWYCDYDRNQIIEAIFSQPAENWHVVYQTDFSSDPGWITDQPANYYWDAASQTYHIQPEHHYPGYQPSRYAYTLLPEAIDGSFELRWDIKPTRCDWSIGIYFGIRDENLRLGSHDIQAVFGNPDGGHMYGAAANGACGPAWQDTYMGWAVQWYTCKLTYDAGTQMMTFDIRDQGSASSIWTCTMPVPCGLTNDLKYLGTSSGGIGDNGAYPGINPWAVAEAYIDNVVLSVPAVGPVIPPIADAGDDIVADANEEVTLDGSGSSDPDGQIIKYTWKRLPDGVVIYSGPEPACQTRALGRVEEVIELTVTDDSLATATDTLKIISRTTQQLKDQLAALQSQIEQLQQQQQETRSLVDRICSYPPIKWWLKRAIRLGDINQDGKVNMSDFALLTKDWLH